MEANRASSLHYPWGQEWTMVGTMEEERFARLNHRDSETSLDPTHFRMYASGQGRWLSPDLRQGQAVNPQSFNRYSYVLGNPANRIDPRGLCGCYPGYDEFDYLLDFGFVPDYGNYGCGCNPFGCGYPLLPPIGIVVFGGGGGGVAAAGVYIPPTPIDYVSVTHPNTADCALCRAACAALLSRCTLTCLALAEDPPLAIACELACSATYLVCNNLCASRCTP
jgi:RHS repeat-associated protein